MPSSLWGCQRHCVETSCRGSCQEVSYINLAKRVCTESLYREFVQRSYKEICTKVLPRGLLQRSCQETSYGDLVQRSCQESSFVEILWRDLVQIPGKQLRLTWWTEASAMARRSLHKSRRDTTPPLTRQPRLGLCLRHDIAYGYARTACFATTVLDSQADYSNKPGPTWNQCARKIA